MPGGGVLTIRTRNESPGHAVRGFVLLELSDNGCGMDAETKKHLFEPFFTTKEKGKGTGLGLATVYGVVKQSRGFIFVDSEQGRGTAVRIYFPRSSELRDNDGEKPGDVTTPFGRETILLVEDDDGVRTMLSENLRSFGYTVLAAAGAREALAASENTGERPVDLIVTDVVLPGLNGRQLATALSRRREGTRVLFISGYSDDSIAQHGVLDGGVPFLQKPFTPHSLALKMREVLDSPSPSC